MSELSIRVSKVYAINTTKRKYNLKAENSRQPAPYPSVRPVTLA